jgi:hypothetical protein
MIGLGSAHWLDLFIAILRYSNQNTQGEVENIYYVFDFQYNKNIIAVTGLGLAELKNLLIFAVPKKMGA